MSSSDFYQRVFKFPTQNFSSAFREKGVITLYTGHCNIITVELMANAFSTKDDNIIYIILYSII